MVNKNKQVSLPIYRGGKLESEICQNPRYLGVLEALCIHCTGWRATAARDEILRPEATSPR